MVAKKKVNTQQKKVIHKHPYLRTLKKVDTMDEAKAFIKETKKSEYYSNTNREYKIERRPDGFYIMADLR